MEHAYAPGRSFDQWFEYEEFDDAPNFEVVGKESGRRNTMDLGNYAFYNELPYYFEKYYTSMVTALTPRGHGLGIEWVYLSVSNPTAYLHKLADEGRRSDEAWQFTYWHWTNLWVPRYNSEPADATFERFVVLGVQPLAVYQLERHEGRSDVVIRYWVGATLHPAQYPNPELWYGPGYASEGPNGEEPNWHPGDVMPDLLPWAGSNNTDPDDVWKAEQIQAFMSSVTGVRVQLITGRHASKNYGYPGNRRFYPGGADPTFGQADNLSDWTRTDFPIQFGRTEAGYPSAYPTYYDHRPESWHLVTPAAMQTTSGDRELVPGASVSYLGNMLTGTVRISYTSEYTSAVEGSLVRQGFECLFGKSVLASVRVGYIPSNQPDRETPCHVELTRRIGPGNLMPIDEFKSRLDAIRSRGLEMEWIYNFGDADSIWNARM